MPTKKKTSAIKSGNIDAAFPQNTNNKSCNDDFGGYLQREGDKINCYITKLFDDTIKAEDNPFLSRFFTLGKNFILRGGQLTLSICAMNTFMVFPQIEISLII